jgi:hypothetical protein
MLAADPIFREADIASLAATEVDEDTLKPLRGSSSGT